MFLEGSYNQSITYWAASGTDGYGKESFSSPVLLDGRWQDRTDLLLTFRNEQINSKAEVWIESAVAVTGYLALGDYTGQSDPLTVDSAHIIKQTHAIPTLDAEQTIYKAVL